MIKNKRILILGSTGLIGKKLFSVINLENKVFPTFNSKPIPNWFQVDVNSHSSLEKIFSLSKPDIVINLSAVYKNLEFCERNKDLVMSVNGLSVKNISNISNQYNSFLIHFSSDYVFDGKKGNYTENDKPDPINYFGKTKLTGEENVQKYANNFCIIRTSMVYGVHDDFATLPDWILEQFKKNSPLNLIHDQFMTPTYLENLSDMVLDVIEKKFTGIIHLAGPSRMSRFQFAEKLMFKLNEIHDLVKVSRSVFDKNNSRPRDSSLNTDLAAKILSHKPEKFELSLEKYLKEKKIL